MAAICQPDSVVSNGIGGERDNDDPDRNTEIDDIPAAFPGNRHREKANREQNNNHVQ